MSFLQIPIGTYPNTFLGYESSIDITTGIDNTAFGFNTLKRLITGSANSAFGHKALGNLTTGANNTAIGYLSQEDTSTGTLNVSLGARSLLNNISGNANVAIGEFALSQTQIANQNVAIGYESGKFMTTGSKNSILGSFTGAHPLLDIRTLSNYVVLSNGDGDPLLWITPTGTVNIPGGIALTGSLSITGGTVTANNPVLSATQTWNNAAVTFTGWRLNVTDTASNADSLLMDLQVGGTSRFSVRKDGVTRAGRGAVGAPGLAVPDVGWGTGTQGLYDSGAGLGVLINGGGTEIARFNSSGLSLASNAIVFSSSIGVAADLFIRRDAANTLAQRNGVNAQTLRVYRTFTDASNYERLEISSDATAHKIVGQRAGTGTNRSLYLEGNGNALGLGIVPFGGVNWTISGGHLLAGTDNAYDIGAVGASRPRNVFWAGYQEMSEMTAPAAPAANSVRIYAEDNGSGKTRLMALFATGAAQQIAIEP